MAELGWFEIQNDLVGYLAASLVVATFMMRSILWLRVFALASNVAFLVYAQMAGLGPIFILHAILLPINLFHIWEIFVSTRKSGQRPLN
ncbi:hypothetical protein [Roseobacter sp. OBYS 0001]|uniref:hypothetical protein n=1 Tax=Roseobacter sp. OBYS 0001 TaxID=882651 RepID=UPI001BBF598F|nr:hypothetical protein [Roseobacter sp. OBYS 0001]GIT88975.1 hypothetical protein ROBYS_39910 [Roseobacter sp. OBYS 0001]